MTIRHLPELSHYPYVYGQIPSSPSPNNARFSVLLEDPRYDDFYSEAMSHISSVRDRFLVHGDPLAQKELSLMLESRPGVFAFCRSGLYVHDTIRTGAPCYHFGLCLTRDDSDAQFLKVGALGDYPPPENTPPQDLEMYASYVDSFPYYFVAGGIVPIFLKYYPHLHRTIPLPTSLPDLGGDLT